jgi:hypothetical protein
MRSLGAVSVVGAPARGVAGLVWAVAEVVAL